MRSFPSVPSNVGFLAKHRSPTSSTAEAEDDGERPEVNDLEVGNASSVGSGTSCGPDPFVQEAVIDRAARATVKRAAGASRAPGAADCSKTLTGPPHASALSLESMPPYTRE
jgi:hypothetical protein